MKTLLVHRARVQHPHPFTARGAGTAARLQRMTLTGRHLVRCQPTPVQAARQRWAARPAPIATERVERNAPGVNWGAWSSVLLMVTIVALAFAVTGLRI